MCGVGVGGGWGLACCMGLGMCWVGVAGGVGAGGGWALRAALRQRGGSAGSWRAMLGLARRVGAVRWVGDGGVSGQDGGGSHARMACNVQGFACRVGAAWQVGGGGVLGRG
ncbi:hypothetical protein EDB86DRAFT_2827432 [Lactarius hatsudake]|nr:hypothetical protein EDB86DRAFT_2827432 [Lactarius hatsudake]